MMAYLMRHEWHQNILVVGNMLYHQHYIYIKILDVINQIKIIDLINHINLGNNVVRLVEP